MPQQPKPQVAFVVWPLGFEAQQVANILAIYQIAFEMALHQIEESRDWLPAFSDN